MPPRAYDLGRRRAAAAETRQQILDSARALLAGSGDLDRFSMEGVAERAGVVRMTVYYQFRSRAGLLEGVADDLARRADMRRLGEAFLEEELPAAVRLFVGTFVRLWSSDRPAMRRLRAMGVAFPNQYGGPRSRDEWRREAVGRLLDRFHDALGRRTTKDRRDLVDLVTTLTSFEAFDELSTGARPPPEVARLLTNVTLLVLREPTPGRARPARTPRGSRRRGPTLSPTGSKR